MDHVINKILVHELNDCYIYIYIIYCVNNFFTIIYFAKEELRKLDVHKILSLFSSPIRVLKNLSYVIHWIKVQKCSQIVVTVIYLRRVGFHNSYKQYEMNVLQLIHSINQQACNLHWLLNITTVNVEMLVWGYFRVFCDFVYFAKITPSRK